MIEYTWDFRERKITKRKRDDTATPRALRRTAAPINRTLNSIYPSIHTSGHWHSFEPVHVAISLESKFAGEKISNPNISSLSSTYTMGCTSSKPMNSSEPAPKAESVLGHGLKDVNDDYNLGKVLGRGQFGTTRLATDAKSRGDTYACKSIAKGKLNCKEDVEDVQREVQIMHHLKGHPNVTYLRGTYEDKQNVHLVMDLCGGGELFDAIIKRGKYSEKDAADLIRTIVSVVAHCHNMGVIHRDLKPENFLL